MLSLLVVCRLLCSGCPCLGRGLLCSGGRLPLRSRGCGGVFLVRRRGLGL